MWTEFERFQSEVTQFTAELAQLERDIPSEALPGDNACLDRLTAAIEQSRAACRARELEIGEDEEALREARLRFREEIGPWFDQSWFMHRARTKPRGYPGDYETLTGIYEGRPKGRGIGGYLDLYFLRTTLAVAVTKRLSAAREFLMAEVDRRDRPLALLNVACGPCREFTHRWETGGREVSVTCVDMDREALAYVEQQFAAASPCGLSVATKTYNALRMSSAEHNVAQFGRPDVIYSIGLCDYVPDNYLIRMLRGWRESLAPEGAIYVAFKDCREYDKTEYAWHVDWHFVARTEEDCRRLFADAGYEMDSLDMTRSESPVIMNFVCRAADAALEPELSDRVHARHITVRGKTTIAG